MPFLQPLEFNECIIDSPAFREKLLQHEKEIDSSYKVFKEIYNSIKNVFKTLEDCSNAFKELADNLNKFINKEDEISNSECYAETEDEKTIKLAMTMYSEMISNIEIMRKEHILGATKEVVFKDLQKLKDDCLAKSKAETKEFRKVTANYYSKLERFSAIKYKADGDFKTADLEIKSDRIDYASKALDYVINIQETEEQKTCKLVHTLSLLIQMLNTYHHQAWDHFGDQKKKIDQVNCALYRTEESYNTIAEKAKNLKLQKLSLPLEQIQPDSHNGTLTRREGYLFVYTKKTVMSDMWTRNFCIYEKSTRKITLTPFNQTSQVSVPKMQNEEFTLVSCERRKSNSVDRRFCFDIKVANRQTPIILQALSGEDLKQWLDIMDGKEPIYAKMSNFGINQEIETIINEKGFRFLSACFSVIEKRGIENQGIYRTSGRAGQSEKIIKKIADDLRSPSSGDVITEKELDTIDINTICSMVKCYIKYLRVPMATYELYEEFITAGKLQNYQDKFLAVSRIIKKLPKEHYQLFSLLMHHLNRITQYEDKNLMTAPNLGVCFSPTIFRPEQATASLTAIRESKFAADVITILIEKSSEFFSEPDQVNRPVRPNLTPSKSMYMSRDNSDKIFNPDFTRSHLELPSDASSNSTSSHASPKTPIRRNRNEHKSSDPTGISRSASTKPPTPYPKPDMSKYRFTSPTSSPNLSQRARPPQNLQKFQPIDSNTRQRQRFGRQWVDNGDNRR